jgi:hypothetical protein
MQAVDAGIKAPGKGCSDIEQPVDMIAQSEIDENILRLHLHGILSKVAVSGQR